MNTGVLCTLADVRARLAGAAAGSANMGPEFDLILADKCDEVTATLNRMVARARGASGPWSGLADSTTEVQQITLAAGASSPTAGTFALTFGGDTTSDLAYNATASDVQTALRALDSIDGANVDVSGNAGGPYVVTFTGTLTGPQARITGTASGFTPAAAVIVVEELSAAVSSAPSTFTYTGTPGGSPFLTIDDCVSVASVSLMFPPGAVSQTLVVDTDYIAEPANGGPIGRLIRLGTCWPSNPAGIAVSMTPGLFTSVPYDWRETAIIEVIRSRFADSAGNTDVIGITQFGTAQLSKAFASKTRELVSDYTRVRI
ncbi:MAG TPA: hypothetical protein VMH41_16755 [Mycobacteriales bacterium]|nr:hypothetical protein [Mycobacteriales bacterium]